MLPSVRDGEAIAAFNAPHIDYAALSPVIALTAGLCVVLLDRRLHAAQARRCRR